MIKPRRAYLDRFSVEENTARIKPKYKLLTHKNKSLTELGVYIFHVLTKGVDSYAKERTINILLEDWEQRDGTHLSEACSKLDFQKVDILDEDKILLKMRDSKNGFQAKGTLKQQKFLEVLDFIKNGSEEINLRTDTDVRDAIQSLIRNAKLPENVLVRFGL